MSKIINKSNHLKKIHVFIHRCNIAMCNWKQTLSRKYITSVNKTKKKRKWCFLF